jgi:hypothetical protein
MTESDVEQAAQYGAQRARDWKAYLEARQAATTATEIEAQRAVSGHLRASQRGLYDMTPQELAAEVAERSARVGDSVGAGRDLQRLGGTFSWSDVSDSPGPVSHDMRWVDRPGQRATCESPLLRHMRGQP